ncbi:uncharacterized protein K460DRAFT_417343 [Cucurbitaria berberidis CBS 394.84]|uniref:Uncharacterized protein n=1 Tax=Cucurbitaria berberidis CBS 394.84 TaxID=1168544 RepID=A0A9P4L8M7_9PLEO|nr:uncharacterized protein K460DRAFT_417343 [Cucurbitaria berberidis CBS 394.84]KAF1846215.1 hypothetical protein K460DRAFT_417343 [Cucurbitaria berberidis CBS 394.84]
MVPLRNCLFLALVAFFGLLGLTLATPTETGTISVPTDATTSAPLCDISLFVGPPIMSVATTTTTTAIAPTTTVYFHDGPGGLKAEPTPAPLDFFCDPDSWRKSSVIDCFGTFKTLPISYNIISKREFKVFMANQPMTGQFFGDSESYGPLIKMATNRDEMTDEGVLCEALMRFEGNTPQGRKCWGTVEKHASLFWYRLISWEDYEKCMADFSSPYSCPRKDLSPAPVATTWPLSFQTTPISTNTVITVPTSAIPTQTSMWMSPASPTAFVTRTVGQKPEPTNAPPWTSEL